MEQDSKNHKTNKRVVDFRTFLINESEMSEGFRSAIKSKIDKLTGWAKSLYSRIVNNEIKLIPKGLKKGVPMIGYFDPLLGDMTEQLNDFYRGTEFAKLNPLSSLMESEILEWNIENLNEERIPLEWTGEGEVRNVSPIELATMIEKLYRSKKRGGRAKPIFIYGAPGIGKTQIVEQVGEKLGIPVEPLDLQFMAPEDFLGIPKTLDVVKPDMEKYRETLDKKHLGRGITVSNPPGNLPISNGQDDRGGIIFMDEMNRSNTMVLNSTMQFVQHGRLGDYQLPDRWIQVAAGNRAAEATVAEFDFALANRFTVINLVPTVPIWSEWARGPGEVPTEVITFIEKNQELFHYLDPEVGAITFPTPRSWTDAAEIIKDEVIEAEVKSWRQLPMEDIFNIFTDQIGANAAGALKAYLEIMLRLSEKDLELMVTDPMKAPKLSKTTDFSSIIYGVSEMAIKKAEELAKGEPTPQMLLGIMKYFERYENPEQLTGIYHRMRVKYPDFGITQEVIDNEKEPDNAAKIEAAMMIQKGAKGKGLLGDEGDAPE